MTVAGPVERIQGVTVEADSEEQAIQARRWQPQPGGQRSPVTRCAFTKNTRKWAPASAFIFSQFQEMQIQLGLVHGSAHTDAVLIAAANFRLLAYDQVIVQQD